MEKSKKSSILRDTMSYGAATNIVQMLGIINSIALRRFMGPSLMGVWSLLQVILGYCGYASFGTTKALMRDYPFLRGRGENEKAEDLKDLVFTFSMLASVIPAAFLVVYLIRQGESLPPPLRVGLWFMAGFLFIQRFYDLLIALLRSDKKFNALGQLIVVNAAGGLAVTLLLVSAWGIYGLFLGTFLMMAVCLFFIYRKNPYMLKFLWDKALLLRELKLGIPLVAIAFLTEIFKSLDKWVIVKKLGFHDLGLYSMATMANSYVFSLPMIFAHIWYPNLQEDYGRHEKASHVRHYLLTPVFAFSILTPFLYGLAVFLIPWLTELLMPKFMPGLPAMKIYLLGTFFLLLAQFSGNFLVTLDRYLINVPILISAIALNLFLSLFFVNLGWGLEGVAGAAVLSFLCYGLSTYVLAMRHFAVRGEILKKLAELALILGPYWCGVWMIDHFIRLERGDATVLLKVVVFGIFSLPFFWALQKRTSVLSHLRDAFLKKKAVASGPAPGVEDGGGLRPFE